MNLLVRNLCCLLLLCSNLALAEMRVIQLQYRQDSEMIRLLQPLLNPQERVAGNGQQLVLQADSGRLDELQALITTFDTPPRRLLITLDDSGSGISSEQGVDMQGRIHGRHGEISTDRYNGSNRVEIRRYSSQGSNSGTRSIQTLEGSAAFISTGQQVPQQQWSYDHHGRPVVQTIQREARQGFYVIPSVQGDRVTLEVDSRNDHFSRQNPRILEQQAVSTRVSGYLGQWIELGSISGGSAHNSSEITSRSKSYSSHNNTLRIKVQLMDE
ncbi:MAG: hypothetical protein GX665_06775 [Gammaproteobacteria bacterium]|nr:hypothetical protein [Gammaproteobacteria bacterium]